MVKYDSKYEFAEFDKHEFGEQKRRNENENTDIDGKSKITQ